jgi:peptide subunit release factor 1 (eRF1)
VTSTELLASKPLAKTSGSAAEVLARLAQVRAARPIVISVYLRLEVQDRIRNRYLIALRDAVRQANEAVGRSGVPHPEREALHHDLARVQDHVDNARDLPHSPGLALFACESLGLFEAMPLPRVLQTRLLLGDRPRLAEALAAVEAFGRIIVALVDRTHARFFEITAFDVEESSCVQLPATRGGKYHSDRADSPGWGERDFHNRIREERHRHAAAVAHQLAVLVAKGPCQGIVLAGPAKSIEDHQRFLPRSLATRVLGTVRLNPTAATTADVRRAALDVRATWERSHEAAILAELDQGVGSDWAVKGVRPTLRALSRGQVRVLVVPAGQAGYGYRCTGSGRLVVTQEDCLGEGEAVLVSDLVSEAVDEALQQHVEVEVIDDPELKEGVDGLSALLRFR